METILGIIILVLDIFALISVFGSSYSAIKKLVWTIVILILPIIGLILWYLLGNPGPATIKIDVDDK